MEVLLFLKYIFNIYHQACRMKQISIFYGVVVFILGSILLQGCTTTRDSIYLKYLKEKDSIAYYQYKYNEVGTKYLGLVLKVDSSFLNEKDFSKFSRSFRQFPTPLLKGEHIVTALLPNERHLSIFNFGKPLTADTINFVNMVQNISQYYKNASDFKLLGYEQVGTLASKKEIKKYVKHNELVSKVISASEYIEEGERSHIFFGPDDEPYSRKNRIRKYNIKIYKRALWETLDDWRTGDVQKGDGIWKLSYLLEGKSYEGYIFINPSTHKVTYSGNFRILKIFSWAVSSDVKTTN